MRAMNAFPIEDDNNYQTPDDVLTPEAVAFWNDLSDRVLIQHENGAWSMSSRGPAFASVIDARLFYDRHSPMGMMARHKTWERLHSVIIEDGTPISHAMLVPLYNTWGHHAVPRRRPLAILTIWTSPEHRGRGLAGRCVRALNERIREGRFPENGYLVIDHAAMTVARKTFDLPLELRMNGYETRRGIKDSISIKGYQASCQHCQTLFGFFEERWSSFGSLIQCSTCEEWSNVRPPRRTRTNKIADSFER